MKKRMSAILVTVVMAISLTACGKFTCDICGEEKSGKKYEETIFGQKITYCGDCKKSLSIIGF